MTLLWLGGAFYALYELSKTGSGWVEWPRLFLLVDSGAIHGWISQTFHPCRQPPTKPQHSGLSTGEEYHGRSSTKPHTAAYTLKYGGHRHCWWAFFFSVLFWYLCSPRLQENREFLCHATVGAAEFAATVNVEDNKTSNPNPVLYNDVTRPIAQKPWKNDGIPSKALVFRFLGPHCGTM